MLYRLFKSLGLIEDRDLTADRLLEEIGQELLARAVSLKENGLALTKKWFWRIRRKRKVYLDSEITSLLPHLYKLENQVVEQWTRFVYNAKLAPLARQAYYDEITLLEKDHLEDPLPFSESKLKKEVKRTQSIQCELVPVGLDNSIKEIDATAFISDSRLIRLARKVMVDITKLSLSRLADQLRNNPMTWRKFADLPEEEDQVLHKPIRTSMLDSYSYLKHLIVWASVILTLVPEYLILFHFAGAVIGMPEEEAKLFPFFIMGVSKMIAILFCTPGVRRYVKSKPKVLPLVKVASIAAFVITLCYGFLLATSIHEDKLKIRLELTQERIESLQYEQILLDVPDPEIALGIEEAKLEARRLKEELNSDPYFSGPVSFIGLTLISAVVLATNALLLSFLMAAGKAAKYLRMAENSERAVIESQAEYYHLLSKLEKARWAYLECERFMWEINITRQLLKMKPTLAELGEGMELLIHQLNNQDQSNFNQNKKAI